MIVDTSALIAIVRREPGYQALLDKLLAAARPRLSAATLLEARMVAERDQGSAELAVVLEQAGITVVPFDRVQADAALQAFRRYGKGRHPAGLKLGDLFAYALAKTTGEPLLYKGSDFAQTDLPAA